MFFYENKTIIVFSFIMKDGKEHYFKRYKLSNIQVMTTYEDILEIILRDTELMEEDLFK